MPPRPHLKYSQVVHYSDFSELETLKHTDHNLLSKPWATIANRQATNKYSNAERAEEEIHHCNEVARMRAWADDENAEISRAVTAAQEGPDSAFAAHLKVVQMQRKHFNDRLCLRLSQITNHPGYSGPLTVAPPLIPPTSDSDCKCRYMLTHQKRTYFLPCHSHSGEGG